MGITHQCPNELDQIGPSPKGEETKKGAICGHSTCVHADPDRMTQVLTNLIDNALKFTPTNGRITVSVYVDGEDAVLRVEDTGIGIASDSL